MTADAGDFPSTSSSLQTTVTAIITANAIAAPAHVARLPRDRASPRRSTSRTARTPNPMAHEPDGSFDEEQAARLLTLHAREIRWKRVGEIRRPARPLRPQRVHVAPIEVGEPSPIDRRQQR